MMLPKQLYNFYQHGTVLGRGKKRKDECYESDMLCTKLHSVY